VVLVAMSVAPAGRADPAPLPALPAPASAPPAPPPPSALSAAPAPAPTPSGIAVLALPGAIDASWPLAQEVYGTPSLRPSGVDEAHARVLCGEPPATNAPADLRDLAAAIASVHGGDPASRAILSDVARRLNVRALVLVQGGDGRPSAHVFLAETGTFDAASYAPDDGPVLLWSAATASLARAFGQPASAGPAPPPPPPLEAPSLATHEEPVIATEQPKSKAFYESGWFWGALGAAAFAAGAVYFATRDNSASTIHLEMQVPH
jgi:hypothetical protein